MQRFAFTLLMLLSGFAGISYEILYGRMLGNLIGDQFAVSAAILITFLFGIGMGALYAHRLWRHLWLIEAGIGLCGLLFAFNAGLLDTLVYAAMPLFPAGLAGNILACVLLLILPAFLIGCSVPLFAGYLSHILAGPVFARVYALYNFGAFATALLIEFGLIRLFGIQGAVLCFAAVNAVVAMWLRLGFNRISRAAATTSPEPLQLPARQWLALILASIASAAFQLFMVKYAELTLGPFRESFALVLSLILLGIAAGTWLVRRLHLRFTAVMLINLTGLLLLMAGAKVTVYAYASLYDAAAASALQVVLLKWLFLAGIMFLPAAAFGATIPAMLSRAGDVSRESGTLLFVSAMANVAGFLLMSFVLHRYLDYGLQLLVIAAIAAAAVALYAGRRLKPTLAAMLLLLGISSLQQGQWDDDLLYLSYTKFRSLDGLRTARSEMTLPDKFRGYQDVFAINWLHGSPFFFINGYTSIPLNNPSEKVVGALSAMLAPRDDRALVLGLGSGATASAVGLFFRQTDVVEINPVVRENLHRMRRWNYAIEENERVDIMVDDAIHYTRASDKTYDLIVNTVTTPLYFSSSKLYTKEFLELAHRRLRPGGVYVTWMDVRIGDAGADIVLNTIRQSFRHCAILYVKSAYFLLACSDAPIRPQRADDIAADATLGRDMLANHDILPAWLPYQLMSTDALQLIGDSDAPLNTMDRPSLEFEMARAHGRGIPGFKRRLLASFELDEIARATAADASIFPADLVMQAEDRLDDTSITRRWKALAAGDPTYPGKRQQAELAFRRARAAQLGTADAYHSYGFQLMRMHRYSDAITAFEQVLTMEPDHDNSWFNIGACREHLGELAAALQAYERESAIDPADREAWYRMGRVNVKLQRYAAGIPQLARAEAMGVTSRRLYYFRGRALEGLHLYAEAAKAFRRALAMDSETDETWQALKRVEQKLHE